LIGTIEAALHITWELFSINAILGLAYKPYVKCPPEKFHFLRALHVVSELSYLTREKKERNEICLLLEDVGEYLDC
jgi:hypothetical protein